ncbi:hypothetical protein C4D60_Mb04t14930 [Musa balbisiana]|uniref:Uncharacterized protein n=1 Tax=Musa balbisiana TaxID=52838 RepID=A0A4S8KC72_MUSBA|nr:hypothetical protein C4D60_Mb04t14930 [Musa balbisiana]
MAFVITAVSAFLLHSHPFAAAVNGSLSPMVMVIQSQTKRLSPFQTAHKLDLIIIIIRIIRRKRRRRRSANDKGHLWIEIQTKHWHNSDTQFKSGTASSSSLLLAASSSLVPGVTGALPKADRNPMPLRVPNGGAELTLLSCSFLIAFTTSSTPTGDTGGEEPSEGGDMGAGARVDVGDNVILAPSLPGDVGLGGSTTRSCIGECAKKQTRRRQAAPSLQGWGGARSRTRRERARRRRRGGNPRPGESPGRECRSSGSAGGRAAEPSRPGGRKGTRSSRATAPGGTAAP